MSRWNLAVALSLLTQVGYTDVDATLASAADSRNNLARLVTAMRQARNTDSGQLADIFDRIDRTDAPNRAVLTTLTSLLPQTSRSEGLRYRRVKGPRQNGHKKQQPSTIQPRNFAVQWFTTDSQQPTRARSAWLQVQHSDAQLDDEQELSGFDATASQASIGFDQEFDDWTFGVWGGYQRGEVDSGLFGDDQQRSSEFGISAFYHFGPHTLGASASTSDIEIDRERMLVIEVGAGPRRIPLQADIETRYTSITAGYYAGFEASEAALISPSISLTYSRARTDDYIERGSERLALQVQSDDIDQLVGSVGLSASMFIEYGNWSWSPFIGGTWERDFRRDPLITVSRFGNTRFSFITENADPEADRWLAEVGVSTWHPSGIGLQFGADFHQSSGYRQWAGSLQLSFQF